MTDPGITEKEWKLNFVHYEASGEHIAVYRKCPECCRYLKKGELWTNMDGEVAKLKGWICREHGEIEPFWDRY